MKYLLKSKESRGQEQLFNFWKCLNNQALKKFNVAARVKIVTFLIV